MVKWTPSWISSTQPRKKRKYAYNAPLHIRRNIMSANLTKELHKTYGRRSIPIRVGDTVKIMRGSLKGKSGKISALDRARYKVYVEGITNYRKDGAKNPRALVVSNLMITELMLEDHKRLDIINRTKPTKKETKDGKKTS
ncbi:50S ribosomal protein L24 [archaeon]|nr:50S ribosomal protein L24 [archaeon]